MHNKSIWLIANKAEIGGGEAFQLDVAQKLAKKGWQPTLLIPEKGMLSEAAQTQAVNYKTGWFKTPYQQSSIDLVICSFLLFIKMFTQKPAMIYANSAIASRVFMVGAKLLNIPVVCHIHCTDPNNVEKNAQWEYQHIPAPQCFIYVSELNKNEYQPAYQALYPTIQHRVIYNGVANHKINKLIAKNKAAPLKIGYVANFERIKGHEDIIAAAKILKQHQLHFEIHLYGDDLRNEGRKETLQHEIEKHALSQYFILHGFINNVVEELAKIDIYLCASTQEAFPLSLLEAMSIPLAIVSTNVGGIPEMITHNENGLLVEPNAPEQLAQGLMNVINNEDLRFSLAQNAQKTFENQFTSEIMVDNIHHTLEEILPSAV